MAPLSLKSQFNPSCPPWRVSWTIQRFAKDQIQSLNINKIIVHVVNYTNILWAAFVPLFFPRKYKLKLHVHKKLLVKCWWNWNLFVKNVRIRQGLQIRTYTHEEAHQNFDRKIKKADLKFLHIHTLLSYPYQNDHDSSTSQFTSLNIKLKSFA